MRKNQYNNLVSGSKLSYLQLFVISLVALFFIVLIRLTEQKMPQEQRKEMLTAAKKMQEAENLLKTFREKKNLTVNIQDDPIKSGFIGIEFSPITTTLGNLKAKQTSTNPNFAALFVHWFNKLNLSKNDKVIIHTSGSFPALSIASIIACEIYGLTPIIISSLGASSFGANIPQLTYWDMEDILFKKNIIKHKTIYATPGGQNDNGSSFWDGGFEIMQETSKRNSIKIITPLTLQEAINNKINFVNSQKPFSLFINIGGNQSALGEVPCSMQIPYGLITRPIECKCSANCFGLIHIFNKTGIPIINMLNIRNLALENRIELLFNYNKKLGESELYFVKKKSKPLLVFSLVSLIFAIGYAIKHKIVRYF
jgi:poly-gamma-glutamate system protein